MRTLRSKEDFIAAGAATEIAPEEVITVEAPTAEQALEQVSARLGPDARILTADKVGRKGLFGREVVRLTARRGGTPGEPAPGVAPSPGEEAAEGAGPRRGAEPAANSGGAGTEDAEAKMDEAAARRSELESSTLGASFEAILSRYFPEGEEGEAPRSTVAPRDPAGAGVERPAAGPKHAGHLGGEATDPRIGGRTAGAPVPQAEPAAAPVRTTGPVAGERAAPSRSRGPDWTGTPAPAAAHRPEGLPGEVAWSADALVSAGLPYAVIEATLLRRPGDDLGWIQALAAALSPYCGADPGPDALIAGPRAHSLARGLGLPDVRHPDLPGRRGGACWSLDDRPPALGELVATRARRPLVVAAGGGSWEGLLDCVPEAVAWVGRDALVPALAACAREGLRLAWGRCGNGPVVRATALEVALAVRELVGRTG